jgi:hypothetical protein
MTDPTVCAALYFEPTEAGPIPVTWLDEALRLLAQTGIPVRESEITGVPGFAQDETQPFGPNEVGIRAALSSGGARSIRLYAHPSHQEGYVLCWRASAGVGLRWGDGFLGVPARIGPSLKQNLLAAYALTRLVAPCRYGIAYLRSTHLAPAFYARGMLGSSDEAPDWEDLATRDCIFRFGTVMKQKRHLEGGFRSVYPAQLLSEAHRQAKLDDGRGVAEIGLGVWTPTEGGLWLWELNDEELPLAKAIMERSGLLLAA